MTTNNTLSNLNMVETVTISNSSAIVNFTDNITSTVSGSLMRNRHEISAITSSIPLFVLQWAVFIIGTGGNLFVLFVSLWNRNVDHLVTHLFVRSMCVANSAMMLGVAWIQAMLYYNQNWKYGLLCCKLYFFLNGFTIGCSTWTLAVIAMDRFLGLKKPNGSSFLSPKYPAYAIVFIWLTMIATNLPYALWGEIVYYPSYDVYFCATGATLSPATLSHYLITTRIVSYLIPLVIIWTAYIGIAYHMRRFSIKVGTSHSNNQIGPVDGSANINVSPNAAGNSASSAGSRRVTLMCLTVASCFTLTSLPLVLVVLLVAAGNRTAGASYSQQLTTLRTMNACIDPIIYGLMWRPLRKSICQVWDELTRLNVNILKL